MASDSSRPGIPLLPAALLVFCVLLCGFARILKYVFLGRAFSDLVSWAREVSDGVREEPF